MKSDTSPFWRVVGETRSLLSGDALARFDVLLKELPSDFFEVRLMPAGGADDVEGALVVFPGPYLQSLVAALWHVSIVIE